MKLKILLSFLMFFAFFVYKSEQGLPINVLDPLKIDNPVVKYALNEYQRSFNRTWAVLVAGSAGWDNYRHQSDVLHMYQILTKFSGIPKEKIILMITDDLANSSINTEKGVIQNEPNGENLYHDLNKDFTGSEVTAENFIKVLKGDPQLAASGKKVLNSNSDENVLVYYSDHGSQGFLLFPDDILSATKLNEVLEHLSKNSKFKRMIVALEACYSGSIFDQNLLKSNLSIYAVTASNSKEESFAEFYDHQKDTYLSDIFTQNWIHSWISCEKEDSTLAEQYEIVKNKTTLSHVSEFGDTKMAKETKINDFLYPSAIPQLVKQKCERKHVLDQVSSEDRLPTPNPDVKLTIYKHLSQKNKLTENHIRVYEKLKKTRHYLEEHIKRLGKRIANLLDLDFKTLLNHDEAIHDRKCYENLVHVYHKNCFKINEHTFLSRYLQIFYKACNSLMKDDYKSIKSKHLENAIIEQCKSVGNREIEDE